MDSLTSINQAFLFTLEMLLKSFNLLSCNYKKIECNTLKVKSLLESNCRPSDCPRFPLPSTNKRFVAVPPVTASPIAIPPPPASAQVKVPAPLVCRNCPDVPLLAGNVRSKAPKVMSPESKETAPDPDVKPPDPKVTAP